MKKYKYKFSVIIPIYNVEKYLEETIESVINQTLDFKSNIEIILVNDGSPDNSESICLKYVKLYPNNIKYIKQNNSGVSVARNKGLEISKGKYINFLDSDDVWDLDVFVKALKMFEENNDVDIIGVRQKYFEAINTYPSLDFKFNKDKVVNIFNNYNHIQLSVTSAFIRNSAINNIRFDKEVKYSEDAKFLNEIIINNSKLGIISSSLHHYRKRLSENSAIQTKNYEKDWYLITPIKCYDHAFKLSIDRYGEVIPYFQYYVAYDYSWRIKDNIPFNISEKTLNKYISLTKKLFKNIDDYIILNQKNVPIEYKIQELNLKYSNPSKYYTFYNHSLFFKGHKLIDFSKEYFINVNIINFINNKMEIRGTINLNIPSNDYQIIAVINNGKTTKIKLNEIIIDSKKSFNKDFMYKKGYKFTISLKNFKSMHFELIYQNKYLTKLNFKSGINAKIDHQTKNYYIFNDYIYYHYKSQIKRKKSTLTNNIYFKLRFLKYLISKHEYKVIIIRLLYLILKIFKKKEIWLISDRTMAANDNGEALFKYICGKNNSRIKAYFVLNKKSQDYFKIKSIGPILPLNSLKYKLFFLLSNKIISSQADDWVTNPFGHHAKYYRDLYNGKFIFLGHGITKHDISNWLNCYEKDIKMFLTSSIKEYNSLLNDKYGFAKNVIKLTGLPRYDNLYNNQKKLIAIMPTWRLPLASNINKDGIRPYNNLFKKSKYFKFYNKLINDKKLLKVMNKLGYQGVFVVHPSHVKNYLDFKGNNTIKVIKEYADYQKIFSEASLLITDYSSVPFDFAYLKKPVIYCEFDKKYFYKNHLFNQSYYNDEKDGFGPVKYNYQSTLNSIIDNLKNNCKLSKVYSQRIDRFYKYYDHHNRERVYNEIINNFKA